MLRCAALLAGCLLAADTQATDLEQVQQRRDADFAAGLPLVAHVVVALCDNEHQGIVPVPAALGNGADPKSNLYWGAMYGVRTYFRRSKEWQALPVSLPRVEHILDRVLFKREVVRDGRRGEMLLLADAWDGQYIANAISYFLEMNHGGHAERLTVGDRSVEFGGMAHVTVFVGHNGLMDFAAPAVTMSPTGGRPRASVVLACISDDYFAPLLRGHSVPLLMTTGLMAPEAYTLDAALTSWFSGGSPAAVRQAAARSYAHYQGTSEKAALRLFRTPD
jgi:hypothetical protein